MHIYTSPSSALWILIYFRNFFQIVLLLVSLFSSKICCFSQIVTQVRNNFLQMAVRVKNFTRKTRFIFAALVSLLFITQSEIFSLERRYKFIPQEEHLLDSKLFSKRFERKTKIALPPSSRNTVISWDKNLSTSSAITPLGPMSISEMKNILLKNRAILKSKVPF